MRYLYLDNFRGFKRQIIKFSQVNFLVGENSTGKTSVINALRIISELPLFLERLPLDKIKEIASVEDILLHTEGENNEFSLGYYEDEAKLGINITYIFSDAGMAVKKVHAQTSKNQSVLYELEPQDKFGTKLKKVSNYKFKGISARSFFNESGLLMERDEVDLDTSQAIEAIFEYQPSRKNVKKPSIDFLFERNRIRRLLPFSPIRAEASRYYELFGARFSETGEHLPIILNELDSIGLKEINAFGKKSGLFGKINVEDIDKELVRIMLDRGGNKFRITNLGYGISQILPIIVSIIMAKRSSIFTIQQPELHLHPKAQSEFGALVYKYAKKEKKEFVIETHSDFVIDRFRLEKSKDSRNTDVKSQVLFFYSQRKQNKVEIIEINDEGKYEGVALKEYRKFFIDESFNNIRI